MLTKCDTIPYNTSCHVSLVPRLMHSVNLLNVVIEILQKERNNLKQTNKCMNACYDETDKNHFESLNLERILAFSLETLLEIKKHISDISNVNNIPEILPLNILTIRKTSAKLFDIHPICSQKLSELSVHLGSITLDSAMLTQARFDFGQYDQDSSNLLDKVKLMADSKINKQYPNLDIF